jgi:hypothetical protein
VVLPLVIGGVVAVAVGAVRERVAPAQCLRYAFPARSVFAAVSPRPSDKAHFDAREIARHRAALGGRPLVTLPHDGADIVLVIVESLSASDSFATSGLRNRLRRFDAMAAEGVLFTNFFANYGLSDGGTIALLGGTPPVPFPMITRSLSIAFRDQESVVRALEARGYQTRVITALPLTFQRTDEYLRGIGVDVAIGRDDHPDLARAPRFVLDAPSDAALYDLALRQVDEMATAGAPFLLVLLTASSHAPPTDPLRRVDDEDHVWDFVDAEIRRLYDGLRERRFFENGLLIVTGDHRKHAAVTEAETARYGASAEARIPLLVIGTGVPRGVVDRRFFQQSDLFRKLGSITDPAAPLSPNPVVVEIFTRGVHEFDQMGRLRVFSEEEGGRTAYEAFAYGANFRWVGPRPAGAEAIEYRIQGERALHQATLWAATAGCEWDLPPDAGPDGERRGVLVRQLALEPEPGGRPRARLIAERGAARLESIDLGALGFAPREDDVVEIGGYLRVPEDGTYWFRVEPPFEACLSVDGLPVSSNRRAMLGWRDDSIWLAAGPHRLGLTHTAPRKTVELSLSWRRPGEDDFRLLETDRLIAPRGR